jgi:hypothetical protein
MQLTVSGTASKIIVGDGSSLVRLILPAGITITNVAANPVDVTNSAILKYKIMFTYLQPVIFLIHT